MAALVIGCAHNTPTPEGIRGPADLTVENQDLLDYDIFVVTDAGMRLRLGMATAHGTTSMKVPESIVDGGAAHLYFEADPIGGFANQVGEEMVVYPGDQLGLTIAPY
jgi:hypothetical protein